MLKLWNTVLGLFQKTNLSLQENGPTLNNAMHLLEALKSFDNGLRPDFEIYEEKGKKKSGVEEYKASFYVFGAAVDFLMKILPKKLLFRREKNSKLKFTW